MITTVLLRSKVINIAFSAFKKREREFTVIPTIEIVVPNDIEGLSFEIRFLKFSMGIFFIK